VSTELANKACAYLLIALINATDPATDACAHLFTALTNATDLVIKANLFIYSTIAKLCYIFIMFIRIIVNTNISKKFTANYKQF
jgi:hypothetical protein